MLDSGSWMLDGWNGFIKHQASSIKHQASVHLFVNRLNPFTKKLLKK